MERPSDTNDVLPHWFLEDMRFVVKDRWPELVYALPITHVNGFKVREMAGFWSGGCCFFSTPPGVAVSSHCTIDAL